MAKEAGVACKIDIRLCRERSEALRQGLPRQQFALVVEGVRERTLFEVAADDRHRVDRRDRRDAEAAKRRDQTATGGIGER